MSETQKIDVGHKTRNQEKIKQKLKENRNYCALDGELREVSNRQLGN